MRASFQKIRPHENSSLFCLRSGGTSFTTKWHFHPEYEFMLVERSHGLRLIGDSIAPFAEGDLVLIGPNLPHVWLNHDVPRRPPNDHAIGIFAQFREDVFGPLLSHIPELAHVPELLQRSRYGVHFTGEAAVEGAVHLRCMAKEIGTPRLTALLILLDVLARSPHQRLLCSAGYVPKLRHMEAQRIERVCRYVSQHLTEKISQPAAAAVAGLNHAAFSRFFHRKMQCTFSAYVTQLRVARAIHLMVDEGLPVSEAGFASGFNNLSNFNRHFRALKGMSPRDYVRHFGGSVTT